ncbi:MAG: FAD binding domain-containing protein [candidate division KSB1 bacterium]|nr:FAD binding domain-containing protein [candidate division KSB1 bacterium]
MERIFRPRSIAELDQIVQENKGPLTFVAGATDLMVQRQHWAEADSLVDLTAVQELHERIDITDEEVLIGAAVPLSRIIAHPILQQRLPILIEACRQIGSVQIQNRATLGGNIANASPAGDSLPVLCVLEAELWIGPRHNGQFEKSNIEQVMLNPGETSLNGERYIAFIRIPFLHQDKCYWYFRKVGQRKALAISKVSLAVLSWIQERFVTEIRIVPGSVTPQIRRARTTETILQQQKLSESLIDAASQALTNEVSPISDIRSDERYRRRICGELLREALFCAMRNHIK